VLSHYAIPKRFLINMGFEKMGNSQTDVSHVACLFFFFSFESYDSRVVFDAGVRFV
jgi:hypothetical protein